MLPPALAGAWVVLVDPLCRPQPAVGVVLLLAWAAGLAYVLAVCPPSQRFAVATLTIASILALVSLHPAVYKWMAFSHDRFTGWGRALAAALRALGIPSAFSGSLVHFSLGGEAIAYKLTPEKLGLDLLLFVMALDIIMFTCLSRRAIRDIVFAAGVLLGSAFARCVLLATLYADILSVPVLWDRLSLFGVVFAAHAIALRSCHLAYPEWGVLRTAWSGKSVIRIAPALALILGVAVSVKLPLPVQQGPVLLDAAHGEWERVDLPFDMTNWGRVSTYNYWCMYRLLDRVYGADISTQPLDSVNLGAYQTVVLKPPTAKYTTAEVQALHRYLETGGGVVLLGDHTNLFGMSEFLNEIALPAGVWFNYDDTYDLMTGDLSQWLPPVIGASPITKDIGRVQFATSCSIGGNWAAEADIVGYRLGADPLDYNNPGFFGDFRCGAEDDFGVFAQSVMTKHGKGNLILFADSTVFSNFTLFSGDTYQLLLNLISRSQRPYAPAPAMRWVLFAAAIGVLVAAYVLTQPDTKPLYILAVACLVGGMALSGLLNPLLVPSSPLPMNLPTAGIAREFCDFDLPSPHYPVAADPARAFDPLLLGLQRCGAMPRVCSTLREALEQDAVIMIQPDCGPLAKAAATLQKRVSQGARVLLLVKSPEEAEACLALFRSVPQGIPGLPLELSDHTLGITYGRGTVLAYWPAEDFTRATLGHPDSIPGPAEMQVYHRLALLGDYLGVSEEGDSTR